jgi:hypothetical protein
MPPGTCWIWKKITADIPFEKNKGDFMPLSYGFYRAIEIVIYVCGKQYPSLRSAGEHRNPS